MRRCTASGSGHELPPRALVLRPVPDHRDPGGGLARDRPAPPRVPVPPGAHQAAAAPLAAVLQRPGGAAADRRVTGRLLGQQLLLSFAAPTLIVVGAPWQPLLDALTRRLGQRATRVAVRDRWTSPLRAAGRFLARPWTAVILFNVVMIGWHVPALYDLAENNESVH